MKTRLRPIIPVVMLAVAAAGCASTREKSAQVSLAEMSAPARAAVETVTAGGQVEKISRETERGKAVYDVEATVGGSHLEFLIAEADGTVLGTEVPIALNELPEAVRTAAERYFGRGADLKAMKGVEYGETSYEVEGRRNGKIAEATFDPAGKRIE